MWILPHVTSVLGFLLAVLLLSRILRERRPPASTVAWLLAIVLAPYVGVPLYFLIGGRKHRRLAARKERLYELPAGTLIDDVPHSIERILLTGGAPRTTVGDHVQLFSTGEETFTRMLELFATAKRSIDVSTFILGGDATGDAVIDMLSARAAQGVRVRLLLDGLFLFRTRRGQLTRLHRAGGRIAVFMPILRLPFRGPANLRNHRKIIVVDGAHAMLGGMNLAAEYMGPTPLAGRWRDVSLLVEGPAVGHIHNVFRSDWTFAAGSGNEDECLPLLMRSGEASLQVVASGPDVPGDTYYDAVLTALFQARERIWVATPYFIPDEAIARGLVLAARRGVDVKLIVPARSNHLSADIAGGSYLRQIERAGGQVRPYLPGMLHAKVTLIDHEIAVLGSANLDMRSLFLDYEIAAFIYTRPEIDVFGRWFEELLLDCGLSLAEPGRVRALAEDFGRLLAPLM
ncbi:MAG TPA: phospholipase D-like domain-containing protein [Polyangiales bacterium]